jgi:hypothetical protein
MEKIYKAKKTKQHHERRDKLRCFPEQSNERKLRSASSKVEFRVHRTQVVTPRA